MKNPKAKIELLGSYDPQKQIIIQDPYYVSIQADRFIQLFFVVGFFDISLMQSGFFLKYWDSSNVPSSICWSKLYALRRNTDILLYMCNSCASDTAESSRFWWRLWSLCPTYHETCFFCKFYRASSEFLWGTGNKEVLRMQITQSLWTRTDSVKSLYKYAEFQSEVHDEGLKNPRHLCCILEIQISIQTLKI